MYIVSVRQGNKYSSQYVTVLKGMVRDQGYDLKILGDQEDADIQMQTNYKGFWSKIELFSPDFPLRPCLFLDLDSFVVGSLDEFLEEPKELELIKDFGCIIRPNRSRSNSGVMRIPKNVDEVWNAHYSSQTMVDGDFLNSQPHVQMDMTGIYSTKYQCKQGIPEDAKILCSHGRPRPHEDERPWIRDLWDKYRG